MCAPAAIAAVSLGLTAAQQIGSSISARGQVNQQNTADKAFIAANKEAAITAADINMTELGYRQSQELLASGTQKYDVGTSVEASQSSTVVTAAESNVSGHSVDAVLNDTAARGATEKARISTNSKLQQDQLQREKAGVLVTAKNQINSVRPSNIRKPSLLTPVIGIATAAVGSYDYYKSKKP